MTTSAIPYSIPYCPHSKIEHLFCYPFDKAFCQEVSLLQRIAIVVFHVLTLAVPFLIFHIVSVWYPNCAHPSHDLTALRGEVLKSVRNGYSQQGWDALQFARQKLVENPEIKQTQPGESRDDEIDHLRDLHDEVYYRAFMNLLRHKSSPWENREVIECFDFLMKISFAISSLTLDALPEYTARENISYMEALRRQGSNYQYRTFYFCATAYHMARAGWTIGPHPMREDDEMFHFMKEIPEEHYNKFYQQGTIQNTWHELYNEYCDRVRLYVDEETLKDPIIGDSRHAIWTVKDRGVWTFNEYPGGTMPT